MLLVTTFLIIERESKVVVFDLVVFYFCCRIGRFLNFLLNSSETKLRQILFRAYLNIDISSQRMSYQLTNTISNAGVKMFKIYLDLFTYQIDIYSILSKFNDKNQYDLFLDEYRSETYLSKSHFEEQILTNLVLYCPLLQKPFELLNIYFCRSQTL